MTMHPIKTPKKLIEVALPLDDINEAASREKSIRHGHPSTLHLWWARRPLAAARAVIFAQMVNDPGYERHLGRGVNKDKAKIERDRLFAIMRKLVLWENSTNTEVIESARAEIWKSWRETCDLNRSHPQAKDLFNSEVLPSFHDPFAGGGALPLEAMRLGLKSYASDLNPVAVMINKSMIEIPARFQNQCPIGPIPIDDRQATLEQDWNGAKGLGEDVKRYGQWMRDEATKRVGQLYPQVDLPKELGGGKSTVIAWLWARTVKSPNPAFSHIDVPLVTSFVLANKEGKEAYVKPIIEGDSYRFEVVREKAPADARGGTKAAGSGSAFLCLMSKSPMDFKYLREEAKRGRMGQKLMAIVVEGHRGRLYLSPTKEQEALATSQAPDWTPDTALPEKALGFRIQEYGMLKWSDLFTKRQLVALECFSGLVNEARTKIKADALSLGMVDDGVSLEQGGHGATAYADAIAVYLAFAIDRMAMTGNNLVRWNAVGEKAQHCFGRQAFPMLWDFAEPNFLADSTGSLSSAIFYSYDPIAYLPSGIPGTVSQADAQRQVFSNNAVVSTDPPYYDNIGYADLSDFFYVWLRRSLRHVYPSLFATMAVPKAEELVATPFRHGSKSAAESFFLDGMTEAMHRLSLQANPAFPTTIYYAFKQSDTTDAGTGNTGWETFLEAVLSAGFSLTGTWPMRTEMKTRQVAMGTNALASSIVLVCRRRDPSAPTISRREFLRELKEELAEAVDLMIGGVDGSSPVAPVDLAQAVIGPGMAIFSRYSAVLEADGSVMSVHSALLLINRMLTDGVDEFDADTQFCLGWFDEQGWAAGDFGMADVLARAKGTSVDGVREAGVIEASAGRVRLLKPVEYPQEWEPESDNNTPIWEALHHLIRALRSGGEGYSGALLARMPQRAEQIRNLAYRLYTLCERKGWNDEARAYNELITSWTGIETAAQESGVLGSQANLDI